MKISHLALTRDVGTRNVEGNVFETVGPGDARRRKVLACAADCQHELGAGGDVEPTHLVLGLSRRL